ncbi:MAG: hypothetical protein IJV65_04400 [Kiritimatiellae bacterium]|nr:hypothetical protein [Kiritimatiellia bacterium]
MNESTTLLPVPATGLGSMGNPYDEPSFADRLRTIRAGLRPGAPERERKLAKRELSRLSSAGASAAFVGLAIALLLTLRAAPVLAPATVPVEIVEPEVREELEPPEPPEVVNFEIDSPDNDIELPGLEEAVTEIEVPSDEVSVQPAFETTVLMTKSPVVMRGIRGGPGGMKGGSFGVGGGSALVSDMVGRIVDLKKDGAGNPRSANFRADVKKLLDADFSAEALAAFHCPTNRLYLNKLVVPAQPAEDGPKAFGCENDVEPRRWIAHYEGRLNPQHSGTYRFVGHFDDLLVVKVDGTCVLDAYWPMHDVYKRGGVSEITGWKPDVSAPEFERYPSFSGQNLTYGDWIVLEAGKPVRIDLVIGEEPGGVVGGILLLEEMGRDYEKDANGRSVLPPFSTSRLSPDEKESLETFAQYRISSDAPVMNLTPEERRAAERARENVAKHDVKIILRKRDE